MQGVLETHSPLPILNYFSRELIVSVSHSFLTRIDTICQVQLSVNFARKEEIFFGPYAAESSVYAIC